jgi:dipeptidyl aminopeptidase/acylaminoacyl peptidase
VNGFGEATQVSDLEQGVSSMNLSPDENRFLLSFSDNDFKQEDEDAEPQPFVVTRRHFKRDAGDGYITAGEERHLYVYDIEDESLAQITSGDFEERAGAWSPDGDSIVFVSNREAPDDTYSNDLWVVAAGNTDKGRSLTRLTNDSDSKRSPAWSPDGDRIAYLTAVDGVYGQSRLAVVPASGGNPIILTADLDRWIFSFEFSPDGDWIYFAYADSGAGKFARVRLRNGNIATLVDGERVVSSFDIGAGGDIAVRANGRNDTADIYRLDRRRLSRLTDLNREYFEEIAVGGKSKVSFESADGTIVEALIVTPPGYVEGRAYPAILNIHGGPVGQFSWGYGFTTQFYASNGYVVIEPNPRGSNGRGQDFINAIYRIWGEPDYEDVIAAVDYAVEQGIADPDRLAVTG